MSVVLRIATVFSIATAAFGAAEPASAAVIQLSSRDQVGPGLFSFSSFGAPGTGISTPDDRTNGGLTVRVSSSVGLMLIRKEGTGFTGNFAVGDTLLSLQDADRSDSFEIRFPVDTVYAFGTQIQPVSNYIGRFTANLRLFSSTDALLGSVTVSGNSTTAEDNTAPFIGALSSTPISYGLFTVAVGFPGFPVEGDLAINQVSFSKAAPVPEPATLALTATGLLALALVRRRSSR